MKTCNKCGRTDVLSADMHDKWWCKSCKRLYDGDYAKNNREKIKAQRHLYYLKNRDSWLEKCRERHQAKRPEILAKMRAYQARTKERRAERYKAYAAKNKEKLKLYNAAYRKANSERLKSKKQAYVEANRKRITEYKRLWAIRKRTSDPVAAERMRVIVRNRRYRIHNNGGTHTASDIAEIFQQQVGLCARCKKDLKDYKEVDHIVPVSRGGSNDRSNLQLLCLSCNRRKHNKLLSELPRVYISSTGRRVIG